MAGSQKKDSSTVSSKEKDSFLDLDIGNDFLSSWKSMSVTEGDDMDFDLTPGNKKSFKFDKADMDFNFDGAFGKMSSFNMDMPDLDISLPLKKDGKPLEKLKESSSGKNKEKANPFAFAFDFDELDNFNFESSFTKECSKDQKGKSKKVSSPSGSECRDAEGSMHMKETGSTTMLEDGPPNPSRPVDVVDFDMGRLDGGGADLEPTKENHSSNLAMDDVFTSGHSAAIHAITSDKAKRNREISATSIELPKDSESDKFVTAASIELPKDSESEKFVSEEPVELEACSRNGAVLDLPSDSVPKNEPNGGNPAEAHGKVNSVNTNEAGSTRKQDIEVISFDSSFNHCTPTIYGTVEISEKSIGNSKVGVADHLINKKQMPSRNDALRDSSSDFFSRSEPTGANPSEAQAQDKANSENTNATGSTSKQDVNAISLDSSSCHHTRTIYENSSLQTVDFSEKSSSRTNKVGVEDHVVNKRETPSRNDVIQEFPSDSVSKNELIRCNPSEAHDKVNSVSTNEKGSARKQDKVISYDSSSCHDTHTIYENSPLQTVEISEKSSGKSKVGVEDHMMYKMQTSSRYDAARDLPSVSLSKTEPTGGNLAEAQDKVNSVNANATDTSRKQDGNVISVDRSSFHYARTIYENSPLKTVDISEKKSSAKSKFRVDEHVMNSQTPSSGDAVRDLSSASLSKNELTGCNSSEALDKVNSVHTNATGSNRKQDVNMRSLDSSSCHHIFNSEFDSTKSLLRNIIKPVGNIGQNKVLSRNTSSDVAFCPNFQNQTLSTLSTKRKTLEEDSASIIASPPFKRLAQSPTTSRNVFETQEKDLAKKVPDHSNMETKSIQTTVANSQGPTLQVPYEVKEVTMSFSIGSDNIIRQAEFYAKELVGLCSMLKKKHDEAKDILVQAVVNSNELLMLYSPLLDQKILATQNIFAGNHLSNSTNRLRKLILHSRPSLSRIGALSAC